MYGAEQGAVWGARRYSNGQLNQSLAVEWRIVMNYVGTCLGSCVRTCIPALNSTDYQQIEAKISSKCVYGFFETMSVSQPPPPNLPPSI